MGAGGGGNNLWFRNCRRRNLKKIKQDFQIQFIIDNSNKYDSYEGLAVKTLEEAETEIRSHKIVIMGTASAYRSMAATLEKKVCRNSKTTVGLSSFWSNGIGSIKKKYVFYRWMLRLP